MSAALRPMRLGEILDRTFQIYRERFWIFFGIAAFPAAGMMGLQFLNLYCWKLQPPDLIRILGVNLGMLLYLAGLYHCSLFFHALAWPCLSLAASQTYLGERPGLWSSLAACARRWKGWFGLALLLQFMVVLLAELAGAGVFLGIAALGSWLSKDNEAVMDALLRPSMGALIVAGFAFSLWLGAVYLGAIPAWCAEQLTLRKALRRARQLSKDSRWRITLARVLPVLVIVSLDLAASATTRWAVLATAKTLHHPLLAYGRLYAFAYLVCAAGIGTLLGPVFPIAVTLLYYDQRIRKEGFDIEWMMQSAGMTVLPEAKSAAAPEVAPVPVEEAGA